jgi:hypothetical protein
LDIQDGRRDDWQSCHSLIGLSLAIRPVHKDSSSLTCDAVLDDSLNLKLKRIAIVVKAWSQSLSGGLSKRQFQ